MSGIFYGPDFANLAKHRNFKLWDSRGDTAIEDMEKCRGAKYIFMPSTFQREYLFQVRKLLDEYSFVNAYIWNVAGRKF